MRAAPRLFAVAALLSLAACGGSAASRVTLTPTISPPESAVPAGATCLEFEAPLAVGQQFGAPVGDSPGDVIFTESGVPVSVQDFLYDTSGGTFNYAEVMVPSSPFGLGQVMFVNNINLEFDFTGLAFIPQRVELAFRDHGGNENLAVNADPAPPFAGELTAAPTPLGGVDVSVTASGTGAGTATFAGPVERLRIGGQEFLLDHVCAYSERGPQSAACIDFEAPLAVGDQFGSPTYAPGDVVFSQGGIEVAVAEFHDGAPTLNHADIMAAPPVFGSGQVVFLNNIALVFDFTGLAFSPQRVTMDYLDQGGEENLAVNDDPAPAYAGELTATTSPLGGVDLTFSSSGSGAGSAEFLGLTEKLLVGGQELSLDNVCAHPER